MERSFLASFFCFSLIYWLLNHNINEFRKFDYCSCCHQKVTFLSFSLSAFVIYICEKPHIFTGSIFRKRFQMWQLLHPYKFNLHHHRLQKHQNVEWNQKALKGFMVASFHNQYWAHSSSSSTRYLRETFGWELRIQPIRNRSCPPKLRTYGWNSHCPWLSGPDLELALLEVRTDPEPSSDTWAWIEY